MKKISTLLFSLVLLCLSIVMNAQPTSFVTHFDAAMGSPQPSSAWVVLDFAAKDLFARCVSGGPSPPSYSQVQLWWGPTNWGVKIQEAPYIKFKAKRTTAKAQNFSVTYNMLTGTSTYLSKSITYSIPGGLTTVYKDFFFNLSADIASLESANPGYKVINMYEMLIPLTPVTDDGIYIDDLMLGDSANPCTTKRPTIDALPVSTSIDFNKLAATDISISGITDGNSGIKAPITITAESGDPTIIANPTVIYNSPDATGTIQLNLVQPPKNGSVTITLTITDTAYCNNKISKSMSVTVRPELLWFVLANDKLTVNPANGEQTLDISSITNIKYGSNILTPDNFRGLSFAATAVSNGNYLTSFTETMDIDSAAGGAAQFKFTVDPATPDKTVIKINFILTSATGKVTVPGVTGQPKGVLTITVSKTNDLSSESANELNVFPNPASDVVNVVLPEGAEKIEVVDAAGVIVKSVNVKGQSGTVQVSTSGIASGNYVVKSGGATASVIVK